MKQEHFFKKQEENNVSKQVVCQHSGFRINMAGLVSSKERGKQRAAKCWAVLPSLPCNGEADFHPPPPHKETHAFNMFWGHIFLGSVFHLFCSHLHLPNGMSGVGSCGSTGTVRETPRYGGNSRRLRVSLCPKLELQDAAMGPDGDS